MSIRALMVAAVGLVAMALIVGVLATGAGGVTTATGACVVARAAGAAAGVFFFAGAFATAGLIAGAGDLAVLFVDFLIAFMCVKEVVLNPDSAATLANGGPMH